MSSHHNNPNRTSWSLIISTFLHGSVIALVALGPAFLPSFYSGNRAKYGETDSRTTTIDIETIETRATDTLPLPTTLADIKSVAVPVAVPVPKRPASISLPQTVPAPSGTNAKKHRTYVENLEKTPLALPNALPEKPLTDVEPQPPVIVSESEQETVVVENDPTEEIIPEVTKEIIHEDDFSEAAPTPPAQETQVTQDTQEIQEIKDTNVQNEVVTDTEAATSTIGAESIGTESITEAPVKVTQSYLELKQLSGNKPPIYPRELRLKKEQGRGQLIYYVTNDGLVSRLQLTQSTGSSELDSAAINAFSKYKFVPGQSGYTVHDFEFSLKGPEKTEAGRLRTSMTK